MLQILKHVYYDIEEMRKEERSLEPEDGNSNTFIVILFGRYLFTQY